MRKERKRRKEEKRRGEMRKERKKRREKKRERKPSVGVVRYCAAPPAQKKSQAASGGPGATKSQAQARAGRKQEPGGKQGPGRKCSAPGASGEKKDAHHCW